MATETPTLEEVISALKGIYSEYDAERLSIYYEGNKRVDEDGVAWYEITTADSTSYTAYCTVIDGDFVNYDEEKLDPEDRFQD